MVPCTLFSSCITLLGKELRVSLCIGAARCTGVVGSALRAFGSSADGPPKKPLNAYMRYAQQQRPLIVAQRPGLSVPDVTREVAQRWKELTTEQKRPYVDTSAAAMQQYYAEMEKYKAQLTRDQSALLEKKKRESMAKKEATKKKRELKSLGKPKRPRTAVNIFMTEHFEEAKGKTAVAKMKALMDIWMNLYAAQKQAYLQLAEDDRIRYKVEMKTWEEQMIKMGREDLVRKKSTGEKRSREQNKGTKSLELSPLKQR
ncbi:transcription factor A, mitochondrial-like [Scleropages formosus]|uniref:transcription factor A, mitochondrial-like n=1 Tax=Scleropages formosus TaxID=113540 RepID=UPI0008788B52|nr:transcription factor A, mitochondrial-like [Scleropages formosus]